MPALRVTFCPGCSVLYSAALTNETAGKPPSSSALPKSA